MKSFLRWRSFVASAFEHCTRCKLEQAKYLLFRAIDTILLKVKNKILITMI